jgi:NitT/TauT family transport system substrate-binding protein
MDRRSLVASLASLPAALGLGVSAASAQVTPLRIGVALADGFSQSDYALDKGFFKAAGFDVTLMTLPTGAAIASAVAGGAIDIGISNVAQLASAIARNIPFVLIAGGGLSNASAKLVVLNDSPFKTPKDLIGKTVAVEALGDLTQIAPSAWLEQNGVDFHKVHFIEIHFPEMSAALSRGTVDSAMIGEPFLSAIVGTTARILANPYAAIAPAFMVSAWFATRDFVAKNRDTVKRFASVMSDTARWANANHDQSAEILAKYTHIDPTVISRMTRALYATSLDPQQILPLLTQLYKFRATDKPLTVADVVATS